MRSHDKQVKMLAEILIEDSNINCPEDLAEFEQWMADLNKELDAAIEDRFHVWKKARADSVPLGPLVDRGLV